MKPAPFRYERPLEVGAATALLAEHGSEARVLAGGQSLLPLMNMRLAHRAVVMREIEAFQREHAGSPSGG